MVKPTEPSLISYLTLRKLLGILGILLPIILYLGNRWIFGDPDLKSSMSKYYYTGMGDVFVGVLFTYGLFLFTYKFDKTDNIVSILAGLFALGVALFPTAADNTTRGPAGWVHIISTLFFYSMLVIFSLYLFMKTDTPQPTQASPQDPSLETQEEPVQAVQLPPKGPTAKKLRRNKVYLVCGIAMIISIILIVIVSIFDLKILGDSTIFWLEAFANTAFGFSWLVKGEGIRMFND